MKQLFHLQESMEDTSLIHTMTICSSNFQCSCIKCVSHLMTQVTCFVSNVSLDCRFTFQHFACPPSICRNAETGCDTRMQTDRNYMEVDSHSEFATEQNLFPFWRSIHSVSKSSWRSFSIFLITVQFWERRNRNWQADRNKVYTPRL